MRSPLLSRAAAAGLVAGLAAAAAAQAVSASAVARAKARAVDMIAAGIATQRSNKKPLLPDKAVIAAALKLEMRLNVERLKTVFRTYRRYPQDRDFDRFAVLAQRLIRRYAFSLGPDDDMAAPENVQKIDAILTQTVREMAGAMPVGFSRQAPEPPDLSPAEQVLLSPASSKSSREGSSDADGGDS